MEVESFHLPGTVEEPSVSNRAVGDSTLRDAAAGEGWKQDNCYDLPEHFLKDGKGNLGKQSGEKSRRRIMLRRACYITGHGIFCFYFWASPFFAAIVSLASVWKVHLTWWIHAPALMFVLVGSFLPPTLLCTCCCRCCGSESLHRGSAKWTRSKRPLWLASSFCGWVTMVVVWGVFYNVDFLSKRTLRLDYDQNSRVAVIGSGASGLSSAWMLAHGGRHVDLYESLEDYGGHSEMYQEGDMNVDLGFIFNKADDEGYVEFKHFAKHFNHTLVDTALNTSSWYKNRYWDNTLPDADPARHTKEVEDEIDRWNQIVHEEVSLTRILTPLGLWTWMNGFSEQFIKGPLYAAMNVLFITKMGLSRSSSQAVLNYFGDTGYTQLRAAPGGAAKVQRGLRSSYFMWTDVLKDAMDTGRMSISYKKAATDVWEEDGMWSIKFQDGSTAGGYSDVVLATPASVSGNIVNGHPWNNWIVSMIEYVESQVTLHTDIEAIKYNEHFGQAGPNVLYFVAEDHMSGKIGKIFGYDRDDLFLTVHKPGDPQLSIAASKIIWSTIWKHHFFSIWELVTTRKFVPLFNSKGGLHYAGDWTFGFGHNDAIMAGVAAACSVGITKQPLNSTVAPLYRFVMGRLCKD